MKVLQKLILTAAILGLSTIANAADRATPDQAVELVHKVIEYMKANGKEKTIAEVNNVNGQFRKGDLYVTINDMHANTLAHGANAKMQGKNLYDLRDPDGKYFMRERLDMVKKQKSGWQDYKFVNPSDGKMEKKAMYFERAGDLIVNCGVYKD
ncbi:cache domain-containing protein [Noviherbaspirillum galbum]|uniref:Histidine kinase n=1 Tax=Noviherbaspirillum galbum TaxID=2709383 RepID=A0A6B3SXW5_9BURK|nr:cache domain-containing protein [Noviherbaspirillum galbum]NEX64046.1 histidine kinase [Noviherbaspirillum galbum]